MSSDNIIDFSTGKKKEPDIISDEDIIKQNDIEMVDDLASEWTLEILDKLHTLGLTADSEEARSDMCLIMESLKSMLARNVGIQHIFQRFSTQVFGENSEKYKTISDLMNLYNEQTQLEEI